GRWVTGSWQRGWRPGVLPTKDITSSSIGSSRTWCWSPATCSTPTLRLCLHERERMFRAAGPRADQSARVFTCWRCGGLAPEADVYCRAVERIDLGALTYRPTWAYRMKYATLCTACRRHDDRTQGSWVRRLAGRLRWWWRRLLGRPAPTVG